MSRDWSKREPSALQPIYNDSEYFSIQWHSINWDNVTKDLGWIDFCSADKMSRLEIENMANELGLGSKIYAVVWEQPGDDEVDGCKILVNDKDVIDMCSFVDDSRVMHLYAIVEETTMSNKNVEASNSRVAVDRPKREFVEDDDALHDDVVQDDSDFFDPDYDFEGEENSDSDEGGPIQTGEPECSGQGHNEGTADDTHYATSDELHSCSDSEDTLVRTRWPLFNEEKHKELQIGYPGMENGSQLLCDSRLLLVKNSFKQGLNGVLAACSKEDFSKVFQSFTKSEQEALHQLFVQVISCMHANIWEEFEALCLETQAGVAFDIVEQALEEQSLDPLFSSKTNVKNVWQDMAAEKRKEIQHLENVLQMLRSGTDESTSDDGLDGNLP